MLDTENSSRSAIYQSFSTGLKGQEGDPAVMLPQLFGYLCVCFLVFVFQEKCELGTLERLNMC